MACVSSILCDSFSLQTSQSSFSQTRAATAHLCGSVPVTCPHCFVKQRSPGALSGHRLALVISAMTPAGKLKPLNRGEQRSAWGQVGRDLTETTVSETCFKNKQWEGDAEYIRGRSPVRREPARSKTLSLLLVGRGRFEIDRRNRRICRDVWGSRAPSE